MASKSTALVTARLQELVAAVFNGSPREIAAAQSAMADLIRRTQAYADTLGRRRALLELDAAMAQAKVGEAVPVQFASRTGTPLMPNTPFGEALGDLLSREPRLAESAQLVEQVYSRDHGLAIAKAMTIEVVKKVKSVIQSVFTGAIKAGRFEPGMGVPDVRKLAVEEIREAALLQQTEPFSRAYAETVYRTNLNTAYTAGRFQQAAEPEMRQVMPAFEYNAIHDGDVRRGRDQDQYAPGMAENHLALDGVIASTGSTIWQTYAPPNGYNCRCSLRLVSVFELRDRGIIRSLDDRIPEPKGLDPTWVHPNFRGGRPDQKLYFGAPV